ncbi:transcription factor bHLH123-like isoform X2 [Durio zibethinus]|uniref:Transcription factor bHLH123-like isoform X2 n=1 Tax=Durio zibethinus TaxID=66656 RepID=A0A6P5WQ22_DURZI|nr:transcription factor bHLH123-like isoform X2 [Durio zibethinus]
MADEFNTGTNWWDSSRTAGSSSSSSGLNNSLGSYGWATEMVDIKIAAARSSMDSVSSVSGSSAVFQDNPKLQIGPDHPPGDLHMMGLGLSSQAIDWNQALLRGDKSESSFRSMLQDHNLNNSNANYHQDQTGGIGSSQVQWRDKMFSGVGGDAPVNEFKQISRGFSLDQSSQFSPHGSSSDSTVTSQGFPSSFQMDSAALYASPTTLQGLLGSENQAQQQSSYENRSLSYQYGAAAASYGMNTNDQLLPNSWSKVPQFLRSSPPKQQQQHLHGQLHFSNNAPFWNPSAAASMSEHVRPGFFPSLQTQFATGNFDEKTKNISEVRDSSTVVKKSGNEPTSKRPRNENPSTLPPFKVRKEKMGDRITALQQLVSPFGKTDTASVLSEAIEYIKFLHEQVSVLSTPYMKSGAATQHQQNSEKSKDPEGPKQDLRSRGLCLVPVSSTFPVTHEPTADFWTPTYGGTYR